MNVDAKMASLNEQHLFILNSVTSLEYWCEWLCRHSALRKNVFEQEVSIFDLEV